MLESCFLIILFDNHCTISLLAFLQHNQPLYKGRAATAKIQFIRSNNQIKSY